MEKDLKKHIEKSRYFIYLLKYEIDTMLTLLEVQEQIIDRYLKNK